MTRIAVAFLSGVVFAVGLALASMTDPAKVLAFLDVGGRWDPSLLFVMAGAVGVFALFYRLSRLRARPLCSGDYRDPRPKPIDTRLITGASLFGIGWGATGYCPGPAVASLLAAGPTPAIAIAAMLAGMLLASLLPRP